MAQGRRKPVELEILQGNPTHRPIPIIPQAPFAETDTIPPDYLTDPYALAEWNRVAKELHIMKVFSGIDQHTLSAYCLAYSRWRKAEEEIQAQSGKSGVLDSLVTESPTGSDVERILVKIARAERQDMVKLAESLGMTCMGRTKLGVKVDRGVKSKFAGLMEISGGKK
jgi:P27 family predicted phage terminase small subunit